MRISDWSSDVCSSDLDAINARLIEGPRMVSAGKYISTYNSIGSQFPTWVNHPPSTNSVICNTKDEMVTEVRRSEEHTSELQSLMRISYAVFCLKKKNNNLQEHTNKRTSEHTT